MKSNYTHVSMLLDRSGSMASIKNDTIGGVNSFIQEQKKLPGEMTLTLCQFDTEYDTINDAVNIQSVKPLTDENFVPRGPTALLDSAAKLIIETGKKIADMPEEKRPERVMVVIITDGEENASREQSLKSLADMVKHQEEKYGWQFLYIGANQDSFTEAGKMGMRGVNYAANTRGTAAMYAAVTSNVSANRFAAPSEKVDLTQDDIDENN